MVKIHFSKTNDSAILPARNHGNIVVHETYSDSNFEDPGTHDTGYDIFSCEKTLVPAKGASIVPTGVKVAYITPGYWWKVESRSGLSFKHGLLAHPGIIDNQYRGDTGVKMFNHSDTDYIVAKGERIAQLVVYPLINCEVDWAEVQETNRGEKGFGSSGKH